MFAVGYVCCGAILALCGHFGGTGGDHLDPALLRHGIDGEALTPD
jgi:hypothetical protein